MEVIPWGSQTARLVGTQIALLAYRSQRIVPPGAGGQPAARAKIPMTTKAISLRQQHPGRRPPQRKLSSLLRELLPLGAVVRTSDYVQVLVVDDDAGDLPAHFQNRLCVIHFVSHVLLAAQEAQKKYGVPASVLIAKSIYDCGWGHNPALGRGGHFGDITKRECRPYTPRETKLDFLREAKRISHHPKCGVDWPFTVCRGEYAAKLCRHGIIRDPRHSGPDSDRMYAAEIVSNICDNELWHCDLPERRFTDSEAHGIGPREMEFQGNFAEFWPVKPVRSVPVMTARLGPVLVA